MILKTNHQPEQKMEIINIALAIFWTVITLIQVALLIHAIGNALKDPDVIELKVSVLIFFINIISCAITSAYFWGALK
jgi:hypothetical protein